ncbi:MAG TPA: phytanoyl-CoA dioxygenase family protein [Planctomycetota bacterium]|nr:phytanoyl-CoA dioxygenase family protein [Planctomycetota bacterium]
MPATASAPVLNAVETQRLSREEIERYHVNGYLGPYALCSPEEMAQIRKRIEEEVLTTDGPNPKQRVQGRFQDKKLIYDLCTHPAIRERIACLLGPDLVLWAQYFFTKNPGDKEIPWHQDFAYWPIEPAVNLSAWLAIDEVTTENSCVRIIPGSHKRIVQHVKSTEDKAFGQMADPSGVDDSQAIDMVLKPGEFFLFNEKLLHQSNANVSNKRRMGMAVRYTVPFVKIDHERPPLYPNHRAILVNGRDVLGFNKLQAPPEK